MKHALRILASLLLFLLTGELALRAIDPLPPYKQKPPYDTAVKDSLWGWKAKSNYRFTGTMEDAAGETYPLTLSTTEGGFRLYGDPSSLQPKVLFIGDSFTQATEASDDKTFYQILAGQLSVETFAYGMAGYGLWQEYLVLAQYWDSIRPDLVVWQVCANDFIDNYPLMEAESTYKLGLDRPYLDSLGQARWYKAPVPPATLADYSYFWRFLQARITWLRPSAPVKDSSQLSMLAEARIIRERLQYPHYRASVLATGHILDRVQSLIGNTPILLFNADIFEPQTFDFAALCQARQLDYDADLAWTLFHAQKHDPGLLAYDRCHWSERGNERVAAALTPWLEEKLHDLTNKFPANRSNFPTIQSQY